MLVIAPLVILLIGATIGYMTSLTGQGIQTREKNAIVYNTQAALDEMEKSIVSSTQFLTTTGTQTTPQGLNDGATAFTNATSGQPDALITRSAATTKGPYDSSRTLIYSGTGACNTTNPIFQYTTVFFVNNGSLYKRTILDRGAACASPWQRNSCSTAGVASYPAVCAAEDEKLADNITNIDVQYFADKTSTTQLDDSAAASADTVSIQITASKQVAGSAVTYGGVMRASSINAQASTFNQAPAAAPGIYWSQNPSTPYTTDFQWDSSGNATGYNVDYMIGSGSWTSGPQNTTSLTYSVPGNYRNQAIQLRVTALTSNGNIDYGTVSASTPAWNDCPLQNGWVNYGSSPYSSSSFTETSSGVVSLQGLIKSGTVASNTVLCTLPAGFRPSSRLIFSPATSTVTQARIDIDTNGNVIFMNGSNGWVSLGGINFLASGASWTGLTGVNSWANYGAPYSPVQVSMDASGRAFIQGLARYGSTTAYSDAFTLPSGYAPGNQDVYPANSPAVGSMYLKTGGTIGYRGTGGNGYWSLQAMYYPGASGSWSTPALQNGWVQYGGGYSSSQYTKNTDGIVSLRGIIKSGTVTSGTTIFTLPSGYRPTNIVICSEITNPDAYARVDVYPDGRVMTREGVNAGWLSLAECDFVADQ